MKYMLIEVIERDISVPEFFDTWEDAHSAVSYTHLDVYKRQVWKTVLDV